MVVFRLRPFICLFIFSSTFPFLFLLFDLQVIMRCAFDVTNDNWLKEEVRYGKLLLDYLKVHMKRLHKPIYLFSNFLYYLSAGGRKEKEICREVRSVVGEIIQKRQQYLRTLEDGDETSADMSSKLKCVIDILLMARDEDGEGLTAEDILYESNTFLFAGHDTTMITIQWLCYHLARFPQHQEKCRREIDEVFEGSPELDANGIEKLTYTTQCIMETLRWRPPKLSTGRTLDEDLRVDGYLIPAGSIVSLEIAAVGRHPDFWEKPDCFHPDNFRPELVKDRHPFAFVPFTAGPRRCLGELFAMEEIKTAIAYILRHFTLRPLSDEEIEPDATEALARPHGGLRLLVAPRN